MTRLFAIDVRSLAALRIAVGVLLLVDLATRWSLLGTLQTDDGPLPRVLVRRQAVEASLSLHMLGSSEPFIASLFAVAAMLAVMLTVGYRTLYATIGSWVMLTSLHLRGPVLTDSGDTLLLQLLFWSLFLPLGTR